MSTGLELFHIAFILFCMHFTDDKTKSNPCKVMMPIDGRISNYYSAK